MNLVVLEVLIIHATNRGKAGMMLHVRVGHSNKQSINTEMAQVHIQNFGGMANRVPWGWRDSYGKMGSFGRVGDKSMFKMYKKAGVGREGDI